MSTLVSSSLELRLAVGGIVIEKKLDPLNDAIPARCADKNGDIDIMAVWRLAQVERMPVKQSRVSISLAHHAPPLLKMCNGTNSQVNMVRDSRATLCFG